MSFDFKDPAGVPTATPRATRPPTAAATPTRAGRIMAVAVRDLRLLLVAVWLGAAVFFSFAVAPSAFAVLPARELAGTLVTRTLAIVNIGGFILSLFLLVTALVANRRTSRLTLSVEVVALLLMGLVTGVGQWVITARLAALRVQMGKPIDDVALTDPLRIAFNNLHGYSVIALTVGMVAAVVALLAIARRAQTSG